MYTEFTVYGKPRGKGRPRFTKYGGVYTPKETVEYEKLILTYFRESMKNYPFELALSDRPMCLSLMANFSSKKNPWELKPDVDNIAKVYMDALSGHAYVDDKQIIKLEIGKMQGAVDSVYVKLEEL